MNKPLTIYKASAGSGKTFTLAVEYIRLLLNNPQNFKHILAVTFTNKATEEMKMRILAQLYGISRGLKSSDKYVEIISKSSTEEKVKESSDKALHELLHNYDYFRVETIDSFFQRIFRNLARELDFTPNLRLDLNDQNVMNEAVDCIVKESAGDEQTRKQLMKFIEDAIADDKGWNVIDRIKAFGTNIFRDFYKEYSTAINEAIENIGDFEDKLKDIINDFETNMIAFADTHDRTKTRDHKFIDSYFKKLRDKEYRSSKLLNTTTSKNPEIFKAPEEYRQKHVKRYYTAKAVLPHLNQLALLQKIEKKVYELNDEANRFLLSDTQSLLNKMINAGTQSHRDNAPFIYEKIGSRLKHIMIDEFQDTSVTQWKNFQVLLEECISQSENTSLIVGDIKQSIYRWRSGDWRLLQGLKGYYGEDTAVEIQLDTNYRSEQNVVEFNNRIFKGIVNSAQIDFPIADAYSDVEQKSKNTKGKGYVRIDFMGLDDYQTAQMERIYSIIVELKAKGFKDTDIAILLRKNGEIAMIADYFAQKHSDIHLVSDEAFTLSSSKAVGIIVEAMRYLVQHDDISQARLVKLYQSEVLGNDIDETSLFIDKQSITKYLPEAFTSQIARLQEMPVYELAEKLIEIFDVCKLQNESTYICTFFDQMLAFTSSAPTSIKRFVKEWDNSISSKTIQSDSVDGIRILTIHKSKGLEYTNVIIPFCDWPIEHRGLLWVKTKGIDLFDKIPLVPVMCTSSLQETLFEKAYEEEKLQCVIDNINLLYVAFTRAERNLFVLTRNQKHTGLISSYIDTAVQNIVGSPTEVYEYGKFTNAEPETDNGGTDDENLNVFSRQVTDQLQTSINCTSHSIEFNQSNESNFFVNADDEDAETDVNRERGLLLHSIFSDILTVDDAQDVLDRYEADGMFTQSILTRKEAEDSIATCFSNETIRDWFTDKWHICNERDILYKGGDDVSKRRRCDRIIFNDDATIVFDFKFGKPEANHVTQVQDYISLLSRIGFKNVRGFLWYANDNKLEEVR